MKKFYATAVTVDGHILTTSYDTQDQAQRYRGKDNPDITAGAIWRVLGKTSVVPQDSGQLVRSTMTNPRGLTTSEDFKFTFYRFDHGLEEWLRIPYLGAMTYGTANAIMKECLINLYDQVMVVENIEE